MDDDLKEALAEVLGKVLVESLLDAGLSVRNVADSMVKVEDALVEKGVLSGRMSGTSKSAIGRRKVEIGEERLRRLQTRRFDDEPIVGAFIDGTAIGTKGKKNTVMIVVGVTAEGYKRTLGIGIANGEDSDDIRPLLQGIVERGVDPGVLWVTDQGGGIRVAVTSLTTAEDPYIQLCTTHVARNVVKHLAKAGVPVEEQEKFRKRLYEAWEPEDADAARKKLEALVAELKEKGYDAAAGSLANGMEGTLTVQKLGLTGTIRRQMRTTNPQESINRGVKSVLGDVTLWRILKDENGEEKDGPSSEAETDGKREEKGAESHAMLLRQVASRLIYLEDERWNRLANPEQLVGMMVPLGLERDSEKILAKLPPSMTVTKLPVTLGDDERMTGIATRWLDKHPDAAPIGSPEALDTLGLTGEKLTPQTLTDAMRCRPPGTKASLRNTALVSVPTLDAQGKPLKDAEGNRVVEKVKGFLALEWDLAASPSAMKEWHKGGAARERVEAKLLEAAGAAVERVTLTTEPNHGSAGVAALQRPSAEAPDQPLRVVGITFAVQRGRGAKLGSPASDEMLLPATSRAAEDAAQAVLVGRSREVTPAPGVTPSPPPDESVEPAPVSPALLAAVRARALELAPRMVGTGREDLEERAGRLDETHEGLGAVAAEVRAWRETNWKGAVREIAAARTRPRAPSGAHQGIWGPLGRGERVVLGEMDSQRLLGEAAVLSGSADVDAKAARDLDGVSDGALARLRRPVARVQEAAEALAARRELERRVLFEAAREADDHEAAAPALRHGADELSLPPADRYRPALGAERAEALDRYARAVAPELRTMDEAAVRRLAERTEGAWTHLDPETGKRHLRLDPKAGMHLARLEYARDAALGEGLGALRTVGQAEAVRKKAEGRGRGTKFFDADDEVAVAQKIARGHWEKLRKLEKQMAELRQVAGSPEALIEDHPDAAIHHAAFAELSRREQERLVSPPAPEPARAAEPIGLEA